MKIIPKYQQGAGVNLIQFTPLPSKPLLPDSIDSSSKDDDKDDDDDEGLLSKDMIKELIKTGLPSDFEAFIENSSIFKSSIFDLGLSEKDKHAKHERDVKSLLLYATKMRQAKDEYDKARERINTIKAESEVAITSNGGIFVERDGQLITTSVDKMKEGDVPITNAQLQEKRANDPRLAFNNFVLSSLKGATSMTEIRTIINNAVTGIKDNDLEYTVGARKNSTGEHIVKLLASINISPEDMKSMSSSQLLKLKVRNNSNEQQLNRAINAVISSLDRSQVTLLQLKAKQFNVKDVRTLVIDMMSSYAKGAEAVIDMSDMDLSGSSGKGSKDGVEITPLMAYATGQGGSNNTIRLTPGNTVKLEATGQTWGAPMDNDSKTIGPSSLQHLLNSGFGPLVDSSNGIYIGDQKVFVSNFNNVYFDGQQLSRVYLPYTIDEHGTVKPNLDLYAKYKEICDKAANKQDRIKLINADPLLSRYIDSEGNIRQELLKPFFAVSVYADGDSHMFGNHSGVIDPEKVGNGFISRAKDLGENEDALVQNMHRILGTKESPYTLHGDLYKGVAFMPIREEAAYGSMWASGQNPTMSKENVTNVNDLPMTDMRYINHQNVKGQKQLRQVDASASKLYN